jgi:ribonucleoside-triphosphate reductase (thioredoxin)
MIAVAPRFAKKIDESFVNKFKDVLPPWGPCGYVTYKRTYARMMESGVTEEWWNTVHRGVNGILEIGGVFTQEEIQDLFYYWFMLKGCPAGRPMWQLGTDTVRKVGGDSMQNCWHVLVNDPIDPFTFTFNQLMLGGGVGFNILPEHVYELPAVRYRPMIARVDDWDCDYIVSDNREGWVELLRRVLDAFFNTGRDFRYDTRCIRDKGRPIKGFGGVASGPEELVKGIGQIAGILTQAYRRKLRPVECMDIMNIIGSIVVAGNVRRSAEIAIGSPFDDEFLMAKDWSRIQVPAWRQMSNNTVQIEDTIMLPEAFWRGYEGEGEPYGLFNRNLCQRYGRLIDGEGYRDDPNVIGPNPCGEIPLESHEACNLAEQFLPNIEDVHEFGKVAGLLIKAAKAIGSLPFWHPKTTEVVKRNQRIGLSVTGFMQARHLHDPDIFDAVYDHIEKVDKDVSLQMGLAPSIKLTTVKPSGTLSLLAGVTPGVHAAFSPHYIRRITFAASDPIVEAARRQGYHVEPKINIDGSRDLNTLIVDFYVETPKGTQCAGGYSAIAQLENQRFLQTHWADNSVSSTIYFQPHEVPEIREWLRENYALSVKCSSFLRHEGHGFKQAPYEEITREQYLELSARVTPITEITDHIQRDLLESAECGTGGCPIR